MPEPLADTTFPTIIQRALKRKIFMQRLSARQKAEQRRLGGQVHTLLWRFTQAPAQRPDREETAELLRRRGMPDRVVKQVLEVADRVAAAAPESGFGDTKPALRIAAESAEQLGAAWHGAQSEPVEMSREEVFEAVRGPQGGGGRAEVLAAVRSKRGPGQVTVRASARGNPAAGRPVELLPRRQ